MAELNGLELGLVIAVSILGLLLIIGMMYYFVVYKPVPNLEGSARDIFIAFTRLNNTDDQIKVMQDVETFLSQKKEKLKEQENAINSATDQGYEKIPEPEAIPDEYVREAEAMRYDDRLMDR